MHETSRRMGSKTQFEHARNAKTHKFLANFARAMCCAHGFGTRAPAPRMAERFFACSRNIRAGPFVYTGCSGFEFFGWQEKTPRWQPRGDDTQSFRPFVQEEKVSCGRAYSARAPVSTASPKPPPAAAIFNRKVDDTHEKQFLAPQPRIARRPGNHCARFRQALLENHQHFPESPHRESRPPGRRVPAANRRQQSRGAKGQASDSRI